MESTTRTSSAGEQIPFLESEIPFLGRILSGHERSVLAKKNIFGLFFLKGISVAISFVLVPITLNYLDPTKYGIWITLSSIVTWFSFFDIGLGNGLRNKLAEALAKNDLHLARVYVSTTYAMISLIGIALVILFSIVQPHINWGSLLNTTPDLENELHSLVAFVFIFFCARLVLGIIGSIFLAHQRPTLTSLLDVLGNILALGFVVVLTKTTSGSLLYLGISLSLSPVVIYLVASVFLFQRRYHHVAPSFRFVEFRYAKELTSLGVKFFILQITTLLMFSTSNIIISQLFTPRGVTPYNIAYRYFSIIPMGFGILMTPFWSAYTDAYTKGDIEWVRRVHGKLQHVWLAGAVIVLLMTVSAGSFYKVWVGPGIAIPLVLSICMAAYVLESTWCTIFVYFINGVGKVQLQIRAAIIAGILNIPLAILFSKYLQLGITGVILAIVVCLFPWCFVWPLQVKKIIAGTATGIWAR
jgi:O-antigen/teichoic acid export membrane protein